jgi:hypothetical protein
MGVEGDYPLDTIITCAQLAVGLHRGSALCRHSNRSDFVQIGLRYVAIVATVAAAGYLPQRKLAPK